MTLTINSLAMSEKLEYGPEFGPSLAPPFRVRFILRERLHSLRSALFLPGFCFVTFVIVNSELLVLVFWCFSFLKVSGVPPLERAGDKKFRGNPKWEEYKKLAYFIFIINPVLTCSCCNSSVPVFWPWTKWFPKYEFRWVGEAGWSVGSNARFQWLYEYLAVRNVLVMLFNFFL